ncbi:hypothetical protein [Runella sp.]|uniref:hypothetical protein n=1 Tax=Runella sp. TaxID=1960881 RepID=UPI003D0B3097
MAKQTAIKADGRTVQAVWRRTAKERKLVGTQTIPGLANNELPSIRLSAMNEATMKQFMPIFRERLKRNLQELGIGHEGDLDESIRTKMEKSADGVTGILSFNFYGRFTDWGVGKGTSLLELQTGVALRAGRMNSRRKPKPWFGPQFAHELDQLRKLAAANTQEVLAELAAQMNVKVEIKL